MDLRPDGLQGNVGMRATKKVRHHRAQKEVPLGLSLPRMDS